MFKTVAVILMGLALTVPSSAGQFIEYATNPCRTFEIQRAEVAIKRPDVTVISPMDSKNVVVYLQPEPDGDVYVANHFNEKGCLDALFIMNEEEYKEYFGINV